MEWLHSLHFANQHLGKRHVFIFSLLWIHEFVKMSKRKSWILGCLSYYSLFEHQGRTILGHKGSKWDGGYGMSKFWILGNQWFLQGTFSCVWQEPLNLDGSSWNNDVCSWKWCFCSSTLNMCCMPVLQSQRWIPVMMSCLFVWWWWELVALSTTLGLVVKCLLNVIKSLQFVCFAVVDSWGPSLHQSILIFFMRGCENVCYSSVFIILAIL